MAKAPIIAAFAMGILALAGAFFVPTIIEPTVQDSVADIEDNTSTPEINVTKYLHFELNSASKTSDTANFTLLNAKTFDRNTSDLNVSENVTLQLSGDSINVNLTSVEENGVADFRIQYPPMFGYNESARVFFENLDIIMAGFGILMILMPLGGVFNEKF